MQVEQGTPFERHEQTQINNGVMFSVMAACDAQITWYRKLLLEGEEGLEEREIEREATVSAMKELRAAKNSITAIANTLEEKFNISA